MLKTQYYTSSLAFHLMMHAEVNHTFHFIVENMEGGF